MAIWPTIPGETPIDDVSGLKLKDIRTREQLSLAEAQNIRKVVVKYLAAKPSRRTARFDLSWAYRLHQEMFGDVWNWAGKVRTCNLNLGVPYQQVEDRLFGLLADLVTWGRYDVPMLEQAVRLHYLAVHIHPFLNGNGRWSRMLANIWLRLHRHACTEWPEETLGTESSAIRGNYLKAIKKADEGDYEPLLELHRRFTPS